MRLRVAGASRRVERPFSDFGREGTVPREITYSNNPIQQILLRYILQLGARMSTTEAVAAEEGAADRWDPIREMPPSAKLVAKVLDYNETMTQSQLAEETLLPPRTVRYALSRLEDAGVVDSRFSFSDARKRLYTLNI
jgi:DNA-binding MarR family transcriptional regulator